MNLVRASTRATALRLVAMAAWAVIGILTARVLSVSERGVYATSVLIAELGAGIAGSFSAGCVQQIASGRGSTPTILRSGLLIATAVGGGAFALSVPVWALWRGDDSVVVLLIGALLWPGIVRGMFSGALVATGAVGRSMVASNSGVFLGLLFIAGWFLGPGTASAPAALAMWTVAQYVSVFIAAALSTRWLFKPGLRMPGLARQVLTFGSVAGLAGLVGLIQRRVDLLLVAGVSGSHDAGLYSAATSLSEILLVIPTAIAMAAVAHIGRASDDEARDLLARCCRHAVLLGVAAAVGVVAFGPIGLRIAYGSAYEGAATPLRILAVAAVFITPQSIATTYFYVRLARPGITLILISLAAAMETLLALALIPSIGLIGAAIADSAAYATEAIALTLALQRFAGLSWREVWVPTVDDALTYPRAVTRRLRSRPTVTAAP
jgi:O-antigen/teichoic acid export membrane protein